MMTDAMQDDFQINPDAGDNWDEFEQREKWQLVPPIVTRGQIPALPVRNTPQAFQPGTTTPQAFQPGTTTPQAFQPETTTPQAFQPGTATPPTLAEQDQESASLFNVRFKGADQNWYSISAHVQHPIQPIQPSAPQPPQPVAERAERASIKAPMPVRPSVSQMQAHPTWNGTEITQRGSQRQQPLAFPTNTSLNPAWSQYFPPGLINPGYSDAESFEHQSQRAQSQRVAKDDAGTDQSFRLQIVQPGLAGLMSGSVSTLAPIFVVAFATHRPFAAFIVGMASALGAGISMAFAEGLSDDDDLTGRGSPLIRGGVTGLTTVLSGAGHALPFLIPNIHIALTIAYVVVATELLTIAGVRYKYFKAKLWPSLLPAIGGGLLVFIVALILGNV
jgi:erythrin-vacuolar iron transport family protein